MAEFRDVMKQAKRMCKEHGECGDCPLREMADKADIYCPIQTMRKLDAAKVEAAVMDWAAKHPEPRYPSWRDAWKQLFPDGQGTPCVALYNKKYAPEYCPTDIDGCGKCRARPIPADIAERLGIKPVGGVSDENA